ncbi:MAG: response regulator [Bacteroidia bacterium]|nr:response regulator [Bacteroidia bacterium]
MIKALIIDDEPLARQIIKEFLVSYNEIEILAECGDGFEGIKAINSFKPELIFLDIKMPKISGLEMLELVDKKPSVIFTTAFDEFALKAFETNAIDYLLKPFDKERFNKALDKFMINFKSNFNENNTKKINEILGEINISNEETLRVVVKTKQGIKILYYNEIYFFEAFDDYVKINTKDECFLKKNTLSFYENNLKKGEFIRVHRSFIINLNQLTRIENPTKDVHTALLKNGKKIPLSRQGYSKLITLLKV